MSPIYLMFSWGLFKYKLSSLKGTNWLNIDPKS